MIDAAQLQAEVDSFAWYHSIDLGNGVVTKGQSVMAEMVTEAQLPDFRGRTVLDIGAWDGYYSFLAERRGASRGRARSLRLGRRLHRPHAVLERMLRTRRAAGPVARHPDFWRADLPGRRGFDLAHRVLNSRVEPVVADFTTVDVSTLGTFDIVLYLGVLYHMKEPLTCLERLRAVTREIAVIETEAAQVPGNAGRSLLELHAGSELNADFGNWYVPTVEALCALVRAAGFARRSAARPAPTRASLRARIARRLHMLPSDRPEPRRQELPRRRQRHRITRV